MEEWKSYSLPDIARFSQGKQVPLEDQYEICKPGFDRFVRIVDYTSGGVQTPRYVSCDDKYRAEASDIIMIRYGTPGRVYRGIEGIIANNMFKIIPNEDIVSKQFLFWYLSDDSIYQQLLASQSSTTMPAIAFGNLKNIIVNVPPKKTQERIVSILNKLDDKIHNNNRINHNLEEQAQALFKSWFVDFEPFKDGKFIESEMGLIPEKLKTTRIEDLEHNIESGRRPKGGIVEVEDGVPSIGAENIKGLGYYDYSKTKYVSKEFAESMKKGVIKGYELLIYKDGGKPGYFIPNYSIFGEGFPYDYMTTNEHVFILDFNDPGFNAFSYFYFQTEEVMNYLNAQGGKAAIPGINRNDVESILIFSPENELVQQFGLRVTPLIKAILKRCVENRRLSIIRDTILPDLMSGKIELCKTIC